MGRRVDPKVIAYERADGTYTYRVRIRVGGRQTTETFASRAAADAFVEQCKDRSIGVEEAVRNRDALDPASSRYVPTVAEMLTRHIDELTGVDPRTKRDYQRVAERSWLPMFRNLPVSAVTRAHVSKWVNAQDGTSAPKTIKNAHSVLSAVLTSAMREGYIAANPATGTKLPRTGEDAVEEVRFLTYDEFGALYDNFEPYWLPFVVTLFGTGLRYGEATALQARDIDLQHGTLRVVRAWKDGMKRLGPPKSRASRRTITLPEEVIQVLEPTRRLSGSDLVFTGPEGGRIWHGNFYNRRWAPACARAGLDPRPRIHDARHTHASWLIANGTRLEVVQERLGHEDYNTTRRIYSHLLPDMKLEAGRAASAAFSQTRLRALPSPPE